MDRDLRVVEGPLGHDLAGPQLVAAVHEVDGACKLGEVGRLLDGRITAANHDDRPVAESREGTVTHGAGTDTPVFEPLLTRQAEPVGTRPRRHDHARSLDQPSLGRIELEGPRGEVHFQNVVGDDPRAEVGRLLPHQLHELGARHPFAFVRGHHHPPLLGKGRFEEAAEVAVRKARIVLDLAGQRELAERQRACHPVCFRDRTLVDEGLQLGAGRIGGGGPAGRTTADDHELLERRRHEQGSPGMTAGGASRRRPPVEQA